MAHPSRTPAARNGDGSARRASSLRVLAGFAASAVAAVLFYGSLLFGGSLDHYDWSAHHYHYFDWVRISLVEHHTVPLYMVDAKITKNFAGNAESPTFGPLVWLLPVLGTDAYIKLLIVVFSAAGLVGMFLLLRDFGVDRPVAAVPAVAFAFNGFFPAHLGVGHHWAMGAELLPWSILLLRRAARGSSSAVLWAAALNACVILGGQHQPFIWQNLVLGAYAPLLALQRRSAAPLVRLMQILVWTAALAAVKLLPMLAEFGDYDPSARTAGLPLRDVLLTLAVPGLGPETRIPGFDLSHGAGWWEYSFYVGPVVLMVLAAGMLEARRMWPLIVIGVFFLLIASDGAGVIDLWSYLVELPVWRTQRSPSRFLLVAVFTLLVAGGVGLQRIRHLVRARAPRTAVAIAAALATLIYADLFTQSLTWQRAATGNAIASRTHRPRRSELRDGSRAVATLREFAPNRLVYRVEARAPAHLVFPLRYGRGARERQRRGEAPGTAEWEIEGLEPAADGGKLAVDVPPGTRDLVLHYRPRLFRLGAVASMGAWLAFGLAIYREERLRGGRPR